VTEQIVVDQQGVSGDGRIERIRVLLPMISELRDEELASAVAGIWVEAWGESNWTDLADVPKGLRGGERTPRSLVEHVCAVAEGSLAYAVRMEACHGWAYDRELLLSAALLHDTSKVVEYASEGDRVVVSEIGRLLQHGVWTANRVLGRGLGLDLAHLIVSHTPMSRTTPQSVEGVVLYYIDMLDSDVMSWHAGDPLLLTK
jgi:HD domain